MSNKNNFAQALKELTGFDGKEPEALDREPVHQDVFTSPSDDFTSHAPKKSVADFDFNFDFAKDQQTIITPNMKIIGDIRSEDYLQIDGEVFGDIVTSGNITAGRLIVGDIKADNAVFDKLKLKGNSQFKGNVNVGEDTIIVGDIQANNIKLAGKVKGNLNVKEESILLENALIMGNITSDTLSTDSGARINGSITITHKSDFDTVDDFDFDFGGDF